MLDVARRRAVELSRPVELRLGDAKALEFEDATFDTVVCTLSLCTIPDDRAAVAEVRRVLRRGGRFVLLEHVRSSGPSGPGRPAAARAGFASLRGRPCAARAVRSRAGRGLLVVASTAPRKPGTPRSHHPSRPPHARLTQAVAPRAANAVPSDAPLLLEPRAVSESAQSASQSSSQFMIAT